MSPEKGGALRTPTTGGRRAALALLFSVALVAAPFVLLHGPPSGAHRAVRRVAGRHGREAGTAGSGTALAGYRVDPSVPDMTDDPATPAPADAPTTTAPPPPSTTTTAPPPSAPPPVQTASSSEDGVATWYSEAPPGGCASPTLAFGTEVQVTDDADGATTSCIVDDREAPNPGRVLDMSYSGFSQLADPSQGVVTVTISW
jgi:hypothetical protein